MKTGRAVRPSLGSPETKKDTVNGVLKTLKVNTRPAFATTTSMTLPSASPSTPPVSTLANNGSERSLKLNTRPVMITSPSMNIPSPSVQPVTPSTTNDSGSKNPKLSTRPVMIRSQQPFVPSPAFATPKDSQSDSKTGTPATARPMTTPVNNPNSSSHTGSAQHSVKFDFPVAQELEQMAMTSPTAAAVAAPVSPENSSLSSSNGGSEPARTVSVTPSLGTTITAPSTGTSTPINSNAGGEQSIKVAVRVRPLLPSERDGNEVKTWEWTTNSIQLLESETSIYNQYSKTVTVKQAYQFDHLFNPESTNEIIFDNVVRNIVQSAMEGFHGSVFTYGQTSSGKTFTMNGDKNQPGIIPQAIAECFDQVQSMPGRDFILRVSYLEVYNEQIKDLLSMEPVPVRIQHDPKRGTVLSGVKEQVVLNTQQVLSLIKSGEAHRHVGSTDMNEKSSRAHTLFKIIIESTSSSGKEPVRVSSLYLVDLAGSESAKMTNSKGERAREAKHINQSLLTLSTIIQRLSEDRGGPNGGPRKQHLPYRDSKLTRILESALDGNAQIGIICTVSPTFKCVDETSNTLKFASRAKMIKMAAKINETIDDKTLLRVYKEEIEQLRVRLQELETQTRQNAIANISSSGNNGVNNNNSSNHADQSPMMTRSSSRDSLSAEQGNTAADEEDANLMLQMIAEMERLILRADVSKAHAMPRISKKASRVKISERTDGIAVSSKDTERRRDRSALDPDSSKSRKAPTPSSTTAGASGKRTSPKSEVKRKLAPHQSNAAMLSMFVEAADSNEIIRIDSTADEHEEDTDSGSETTGSSDEDAITVSESTLFDVQPLKDTKPQRVIPALAMAPAPSSALKTNKESPAQPSKLTTPIAPLPAHPVMERRNSASALVDSQHTPIGRKDTFFVNGKGTQSSGGSVTSGGSTAGSSTGTSIPRVLRPQTVRGASFRAMSASMDDDDLLHVPSERPRIRHDSFEDYDTEDSRLDSSRLDSNRDSSIWTSENEMLPDLTRETTPGLPGAFADSIEDDSVLLGVSKMLMILKGHVSKARARYNLGSNSAGDLHRLEESPVTTPGGGRHERRESRELQLQPLQAKSVDGELRLNEKFDYERLKLDFKLKEADNRFLQEELENKNKMLTMLTEGLKEVELSQTQWLTANQDLSYELEKALFQNKCLKAEMAKLREQLHLQQRSDLAPEIAKVLLNSPMISSIPEETSEDAADEEEEVHTVSALSAELGLHPVEANPNRVMLRTKQIFVESPDSDTSDSDVEV